MSDSSDPIRRAWAAWEAHERRTDVQLSLDFKLHLTGPVEDDSLPEEGNSDRRENEHV